ncbi:MAG: alpha-glucosidase [Acidobacteriota bacterium]|nr:alpha-glucosidase [Acidobacteriota bacterium]
MRRLSLVVLLALCSVAPVLAQGARPTVPDSAGDPWWKHAVIYEIYPRSFQDTNRDGVGDLKGIASRLAYLHQLGVDAIWITPMYPSPQVDFGYDISDYEAIDPIYGTMGDFDDLMKVAKQQGIRVIMDLVLNHTSDQHPWFLQSRSSRTNPKRDWYIWHDPAPGGGPPNNWQSWFGHSAWTLDPTTGQYYYHYFYVQQPDLNWRNPEVKKAMYDVLRFWLDKGVSGFRMDAVSRLFEDPNLHDDPYLPGSNAFGDRNIQHKYTDDLPEIHDVFREIRKLVDSYPGHPVLISEADEPNIQGLARMYGHDDEIQLPMDFQIADANELSATKFRKLFQDVENNPAHGWPEFFFSNHDQPRQWDRYGDGTHNQQIAGLMAILELTARGTPQMYYGEEIGMRTTEPTRKEDVRDPEGITGWPKEKGRDGERTPMQWTAEAPNAGFSPAEVKTWLPVPESARTVNVATESAQPESLYNLYRRLLALRHTEPALIHGDYRPLNEDDPNVFSYMRQARVGDRTRKVVVALNMSNAIRTIRLQGSKAVGPGATGKILASNFEAAGSTQSLGEVKLPAFGGVVIGIQ